MGGKEKGTTSISEQEALTFVRPECVSEYEESDDEIHTPYESEEEDISGRRRRTYCEVVNENTNFSIFLWKVRLRFPNRDAFKKEVVKFAVTNGMNLSFVVNNKNRQQRLRVNCLLGCPFRLYASWDSWRACFVVKSVDGEHSCNKNIEANKQMKSTWLDEQFLEVFKERPH